MIYCATFGGLPRRLGSELASSFSMYASASRHVAYSTRLLWILCGKASLPLRLVISSSVIARPFSVMRDVLFSTLSIRRAIPSGIVRYDWSADDTNAIGSYQAEFEVTYADASVETFPNRGYIRVEIIDDIA